MGSWNFQVALYRPVLYCRSTYMYCGLIDKPIYKKKKSISEVTGSVSDKRYDQI